MCGSSMMPSSGSSPHKWGIPKLAARLLVVCRFIPTQVGNTFKAGALPLGYAVHPHTSGEYASFPNGSSTRIGSSPHKWGIRFPSKTLLIHRRFIPTQVGNTRAGINRHLPFPVHPHTSGEYVYARRLHHRHFGSSPHKWGILSNALFVIAGNRFIPTQVGNTLPHGRGERRYAVHPHTSGEYACLCMFYGIYLGSSPHKWGIQVRNGHDRRSERFIPTQVGNTCACPYSGRQDTVHPHTSGEY